MIWHDLLFMHWPMPAHEVQPLLPAGLPLDTCDGQAWLGVVPFCMKGIHAHNMPRIPGLSAMPELNVRTYVTLGGKPGVYFFSLDAASAIAVTMARMIFHLPYFYARMKVETQDGQVNYSSLRMYRDLQADFIGSYRPSGPVYRSEPGRLDHWLTERYCLYTADTRGRLLRGDIHHQPWPLQPAQASIDVNTMAVPLTLELPDTPPLLHFAKELEVVAWCLRPVEDTNSASGSISAASDK
jgi:uncharacterized protein YqjF (DUF2071 family)